VGLVHAELRGHGGGGNGFCSVDGAPAWPRAESEGGGEGLEGPHGLPGRPGGKCCWQMPGAGPGSLLSSFPGAQEGQGKQQRLQRVALMHPPLRARHFIR
jgi:hypothetical protein